jgi:hypothetical protein
LHLFTCVYMIWTTSLLPSRQNLFYPLLQFCGKKDERYQKHVFFFLVWDKDSYIGRFLVLFPRMYVLQHKLVNLYQISSLLHGPLPTVALTSSRLLSLNTLTTFKFFISFPCPITPVHGQPLLWSVSNNITAIVIGL